MLTGVLLSVCASLALTLAKRDGKPGQGASPLQGYNDGRCGAFSGSFWAWAFMFCALLLNTPHRLLPAEAMVLLTGLEVVVSAAERVKKLCVIRAIMFTLLLCLERWLPCVMVQDWGRSSVTVAHGSAGLWDLTDKRPKAEIFRRFHTTMRRPQQWKSFHCWVALKINNTCAMLL